MDRTGSKIDTPLAHDRSRPVHFYELIDKDGQIVGRYAAAAHAVEDAMIRWPDHEQDPDRTGKGWTIQLVGADYIHQRAERGPVHVCGAGR